MDLDGKFLIASPGLLDPNFKKSIILVIDHKKDQGTFGLVLNRPGPVSVSLFCEGMGLNTVEKEDSAVYLGGPVQPSVGWLLHQKTDDREHSRRVVEDVYISNSREMLERLTCQSKIQHRVFIGYAGWAPFQLAQEMRAGSWFTADVDPSLIFSGSGDHAWEQAVKNLGIDPNYLVPGSTEIS